MDCKKIVFSGHAIWRIFERGITEADVSRVITEGEVIARILKTNPFPVF